jgi:hypothetical protein
VFIKVAQLLFSFFDWRSISIEPHYYSYKTELDCKM